METAHGGDSVETTRISSRREMLDAVSKMQTAHPFWQLIRALVEDLDISPLQRLLLDVFNVRMRSITSKVPFPSGAESLWDQRQTLIFFEHGNCFRDLIAFYSDSMGNIVGALQLFVTQLGSMARPSKRTFSLQVRAKITEIDAAAAAVADQLCQYLQARLQLLRRETSTASVELADTFETVMVEIGILASNVAVTVVDLLDVRKLPSEKQTLTVKTVMFAVDHFRLVTVRRCLRRVLDVLDADVALDLTAELAGRLDRARHDPNAYRKLLDLQSKDHSWKPPTDLDAVLDDDGRRLVQELDEIVVRRGRLPVRDLDISEGQSDERAKEVRLVCDSSWKVVSESRKEVVERVVSYLVGAKIRPDRIRDVAFGISLHASLAILHLQWRFWSEMNAFPLGGRLSKHLQRIVDGHEFGKDMQLCRRSDALTHVMRPALSQALPFGAFLEVGNRLNNCSPMAGHIELVHMQFDDISKMKKSIQKELQGCVLTTNRTST